MSTTSRRLSVVATAYALGLLCVLAHLFYVMLVDHDAWLVRSYRNRWAFRDVPSVRGALLDRFDRWLSEDEPTFELSCVYERFRALHPVGAAVHAATLWTRLAGGSEVRFGYQPPALGPERALAELLEIPVAALRRADFERRDRQELVRSVLVVLGAASDRTTSRVYRELRAARDAGAGARLGDALPGCPRSELVERFRGILARLQALDRALQEQAAAAAHGDGAAGPRGLLAQLDRFRIDCLEQRCTERRLDDGSIRTGEPLERVARPVLRELPFPLAAALRLAAADQPGLRLEPSLRRRRRADLPPTLAQLLGGVADLDRSPAPSDYVEQRVEQALADELDDLVPEDVLPTEDSRQDLLQEAQRSYERVLLTRERRGTGGIEAMVDAELAGTPGLRLVEHDARAREQLLWSSLRVLPGNDVALSVDLDLQALLDRAVAAACAHWQEVARARGLDPGPVDVAMAMIDARGGDVLALAGAPAELDGRPRLPAVLSWRGDGSVGSLVKPFFLLEQLSAPAAGLPCRPLAEFVDCAQDYRRIGGQWLRCDGSHGAEGRDPVAALAQSCNVFFFQVAEGLGEPGLRRALCRAGLLPPTAGDGDGRWQARPAELPAAMVAAPRWVGRRLLQWRGIGYGIEANPLAMARAYAGLATGTLPTLGLLRGAARPGHPLGVAPADLATALAGLAACVERGTAKGIPGLAAFAVRGKTGTAEVAIGKETRNNASFAGFLPAGGGAAQLAFCAVVYAVPDKVHGADAAGLLVGDVLQALAAVPDLRARYLPGESGR